MINYANQKTYPIDRNFSLAQINVRGLFHKLDQIRLLLYQKHFSVLGICETFLVNSKPTSLLTIPGYNMVRRDRLFRGGGGVVLYIKDSLQFENLPQISSLLDESITIRILPNVAKPFLISIIYRPPQSCISWKTSFFEYLELCQVTCNEIIL